MLIESPEAFKLWLVKALAPMWVNICRRVDKYSIEQSPTELELELIRIRALVSVMDSQVSNHGLDAVFNVCK